MGSQGWPGGFGCESGDVLVGLVELYDCLGSDELFGCDVEAVGVALYRLEKPGRWVVELAQQGAGGDGRFVAGEDLLQRLGRQREQVMSGRRTVWGSPSPTTWR